MSVCLVCIQSYQGYMSLMSWKNVFQPFCSLKATKFYPKDWVLLA